MTKEIDSLIEQSIEIRSVLQYVINQQKLLLEKLDKIKMEIKNEEIV